MSLDEFGFEYWDKVINEVEIQTIKREISNLNQDIPRYGIRSADKLLPSVHKLAYSEKVLSKVEGIIGPSAKLARAVIFDKSPDKNWFVPWHQDRTVPLSQKLESSEWKNWTVKRGILHAEAPIKVLKNMLTLRVDLDDTSPENGGMKFIEGTHERKIPAEALSQLDKSAAKDCLRSAGDVFIMRPLLLHSSNKSTSAKPRQVIHLEFSSFKLPDGIHWAS